MEDTSTPQAETPKKQVQNEPTETQNEGTTNYLQVLLVSLVILYLFMNNIDDYKHFVYFLLIFDEIL